MGKLCHSLCPKGGKKPGFGGQDTTGSIPCALVGKGTDPWDPLLHTCPVPVPLCTSLARVPVPVPLGLARGRAELPGRGVPGEGRAGQRCAWLIRQPLKQVSLRPICLAERKEPPGAVPASQGTIPGLYTPLQGISSPRLKHKQTNSKKCLAPSSLAATGRIQPTVPRGFGHHCPSAPCPLLLHPRKMLGTRV